MKIQAITKIAAPTSTKELKAFLGAINYYGKYIQDFSTISNPLFKLLRKGVEWAWSNEQNDSFLKLKKCLTEAPVLMIYNRELPLKLDTDASSYGLGAVLSHVFPDGSERPIAYASRSLNESEIRYSQVDKEGAAIIFALNKFQQYLLGRRFQLVVDNKAISRIFHPDKQLPGVAANRLSRWAIIMTNYDFEITFRHSEEHGNADMLSRLPLKVHDEPSEDEKALYIESSSFVPVVSDTIIEETKKDRILRQVTKYLQNDSWPMKPSPEIRPYARIKDELSLEQGDVVYWGMRVVIPASLKSKILEEVHWNHWGIVRMKGLSRRHVWYPGINNDIEHMVQNCDNCQKNANCPPASVPHPWDLVSNPMERIHMDYIGPYHNKYVLVMKDAYSGWIEAQTVTSADTKTTVKIMKKWRSRWGLPKQTVTDNGTEFTSGEFKQFARSNGIDHVTSPAYHQSSNGAAERAVQTIKRGLEKKDLQPSKMQEMIDDFLWGYRSTPRDNGKTPSELFLGWNIRTRLDLIKPEVKTTVKSESVCKRNFECNDKVLVKNERRGKDKWIPGVVVKVLGCKCYIVRIPGRRPVKRHIDQLLRYRGKVEDDHDMNWDIGPTVESNDVIVPQGSIDGPSENPSIEDQDRLARSPYPQRDRRPPDRLQVR